MTTETTETTRTTVSDDLVLQAMEVYGGNFVKALAFAWRRADADNTARLRAAFSDVWDRYTEFARTDAALAAGKEATS